MNPARHVRFAHHDSKGTSRVTLDDISDSTLPVFRPQCDAPARCYGSIVAGSLANPRADGIAVAD